jgi:hypothetical protein
MRLTGQDPATEGMGIMSLDFIFGSPHSYTETSVIACMPRHAAWNSICPRHCVYSMRFFKHTSLPTA